MLGTNRDHQFEEPMELGSQNEHSFSVSIIDNNPKKYNNYYFLTT